MKYKIGELQNTIELQNEQLKNVKYDLQERTKELECFYRISRIVESEKSLDNLLQKIADVIPLSWQYPEITCARIVYGDKVYRTLNYRKTIYKQSSNVIINGEKSGVVEVYYLKKKPDVDEGPFLNSERKLIDSLVERIGKIIQRANMHDELKQINSQLHKLFERILNIREEERKMIAQNIHDEFGQLLTAMKINIKWLKKKLPKKDDFSRKIRDTENLINNAYNNMYSMVSELRPRLLDDFGFSVALSKYIKDFQKRTKIVCNFKKNINDSIITTKKSLAIFRILQELFTNVSRHSKATKVDIRIDTKEGKVNIKFCDNGIGIKEKDINNNNNFGLLGIKERINNAKGKFNIKSSKNKGTYITIEYPV